MIFWNKYLHIDLGVGICTMNSNNVNEQEKTHITSKKLIYLGFFMYSKYIFLLNYTHTRKRSVQTGKHSSKLM